MNWIIAIVAFALLSSLAQSASAALNVFACEPEWGALAKELGGDNVSVYVATTARQDPHRIEARPSLIAQVRRADLVVCTGAELEIGWLPLLLRQSGNPRVQPNQRDYLAAADYVRKLEVPTVLDRALGDVHSFGNPHIQTDPRNIARVAEALGGRLAEIDAANAARYRSRYQDFAGRWSQAIQRWQAEAAPLKGVPFVAHHKTWVYLSQWLGLREVATLEPKPGIPPSSAHLAEVLAQLQREPAKMVVRSAYEGPRPSEWLAQRAHIPAVELPLTVGGSEAAKDLFSLFDDTLHRLLSALR
jgi:zinc/manganese transport system substrate-binding protein